MSTPLDAYLRDANLSDSDFGALIGRDRTMVNKLRNGVLRPTLEVAGLIETHSAGRVPMQSWVPDLANHDPDNASGAPEVSPGECAEFAGQEAAA